MKIYKYLINMKVPLGIRQGVMIVNEINGFITGKLDILGHIESFAGYLYDDGECKIYGNITSLTKTISYQAMGQMNEESISLDFYTDLGKFYAFGKKEEYHEKVL